jgi:hypothetical protein
MSDPSYKYWSQLDFTGGIATEPELRRVGKGGEVTVAEAADVWAPNGVLTRRPGVTTNIFLAGINQDGAVGTSSNLAGAFFRDFSNTVYPVTVSGSNFSATVPPGTVGNLYLPVTATPSSAPGYSLCVGIYWKGIRAVSGGPTFSAAQCYYLPPGGVPGINFQPVDTSSVLFGATAIPNSVIASAGLDAGLIKTGTLWVSFQLTVGSLGTIPVINPSLSVGIGYPDMSDNFIASMVYAPLPSGEVYLGLSTSNTGLGVFVTNSLDSQSLLPSKGNQTIFDPSLYNYIGAPAPSWAPVVDANRVYVAFSNQIYEYRPELGVFRNAQVNSAQEVVGSIEGIPSPFNPTYIAQFQSFPQANQITYFNGLLFMTDIKGAPNVVQWGGPASSGAVDVLPVLSYAILADSRDNSPNVGFGVYNQNLYVFKRNSIWALVPSGQSTVDGSYLFTSKLVTSGAGCSAPGSIVSTPAGIIFYNSGGFYIFDGVRTQKLSAPIKHIVDAISPGSVPQAQAIHWAQQHCYIISLKMSPPWHSAVFNNLSGVFQATLLYDYQNNAWWLWLSTSDQAIAIDVYQNVFTTSGQSQIRILDPNKTYDGEILAKSSATPYFKTQRFGFGESIQHNFGELRIRGEIDNLSYTITQTPNDQLPANADLTTSFSMLPANYALIDQNTVIPDGSPYSPPWGRHEARKQLNNNAQWTQFSIAGSYGPFTVYGLEVGYLQDGRN